MVELINNAMMRAMTAVGELRARLAEERGQDLLEYALLGGLIAAAITAAAVFTTLSGALDGLASGIAECINFNDLQNPCSSTP